MWRGVRRVPGVRRVAALGLPALGVVAALLLLGGWARGDVARGGDASYGATHETLVVADLRGHALLVLDPSQPAEARRIPLPGGPHEMLPLPDGRLLVSLEQYGMLVAVDLDSGAVEEVRVGGVPHGLALCDALCAVMPRSSEAPQTPVVLVTDRSVDAVRAFAVPGWEELPASPVDAWPHAIALVPGGELAVASARAGTVQLGPRSIAIGRTTETLAVRGDGAVATAAATDGVVAVIAADGTRVGWWDVGGRPVRVAFSPDGTTLVAALSAGGAVAVIDGHGVSYVAVPGVPDGLAFSSDGRTLYVSDIYGGRVSAIDLDRRIVAGTFEAGVAAGALLILER